MINRITLPFIVAVICIVVATISKIQGNSTDATYMLGLAIFNMVVHIGIRQEEK